MLYLGVDPGESGAWAVIDENCKLINAALYKEDRQLELTPPYALAAIEKVHSMPRQGVVSTFTFAENYGRWQGYLAGLGVPYHLVTPQRWQKEILDFQITREQKPVIESEREFGRRTARNRRIIKEGIVDFVRRQVPGAKQVITLKKHWDIADAICIALYARKAFQPFLASPLSSR